MGKTVSSASPAGAVDYDAMLIMAVETSSKRGVAVVHVPGLGAPGPGLALRNCSIAAVRPSNYDSANRSRVRWAAAMRILHHIRPPCRSINSLSIARPSPVPRVCSHLRQKGSKTLSLFSAHIPSPWKAISTMA